MLVCRKLAVLTLPANQNHTDPNSNLARGWAAEILACNFLIEKGYQLVHKNYRAAKAEIDLIMTQGETIIFVEVKMRKQLKFGLPEQAVTPQKMALLQQAATQWVFANNHFGPIRFDIISIYQTKSSLEVVHFQDVS